MGAAVVRPDEGARGDADIDGDPAQQEQHGCNAERKLLLAALQSRAGRGYDSASEQGVASGEVLAHPATQVRRGRERDEGEAEDDEGCEDCVDERVHRKETERRVVFLCCSVRRVSACCVRR